MNLKPLPPMPPGMPREFQEWHASVDAAVRLLVTNILVNAANDAAAAAAGVPLNGLYRNGSVVQIRVT